VTSSTASTTTVAETIAGNVAAYSATEYAAIFSGIEIGECTIRDRTASVIAPNPASPDAYLDAGVTLPASGPGLTAGAALGIISTNPGPIYDLVPPTGTIVGGGTYTVTGRGGKGVGPFTASVAFPGSFTVANWDSLTTVNRSQPVTLNWTGGVDKVDIIFSTSAVVGKDASNNNILHTASFTCEVPAAPGTYTIPTSVLSHLLPANAANGTASLGVETVTSQPFTAPLTAGGQAAIAGFSAVLGYARNLTVQ
jgi:hypothetical protein